MAQPETTTLRSRVIKGIGAQGFGQVVQILVRLGEVPLFLHFWGAICYGEWLMLSTIPAYFSMSDGGFTQTSCRDITMKAGKGDQIGALAVYQSTSVLLLGLSIVIGFLSVILAVFAPINQWINLTAISRQESALVFLILVANCLVTFQGGLLISRFWAVGRYPQSMILGSLIQFLSFGLMALAVVLGGGPVYAATGFFLGRFIVTLIIWAIGRKISPWLYFGFQYVSLKQIRNLLAPSIASLAFPFGIALNSQAIRLVVGLLLGPTAVAIYVPLRTLSNFVIQPRQMVNQMTEPEMAIAFGAKNKPLYQKLFLQSVRLSFWACLLVAVLLIPTGYLIYPFWTTNEVSFHWPTFVFLLVSAVINSIWYTALMVSYSTNRHGRNAVYFLLIYGVAYVVVAFPATYYIGMAGPSFVLITIEILMTLLVVYESMKMTDTKLNQVLLTLANPPVDEVKTGFTFFSTLFLRSALTVIRRNNQ